MALKMLYRGPSSRLETLIEKIQQNKDSASGILCFIFFFVYFYKIKKRNWSSNITKFNNFKPERILHGGE